MVLATRSMRVRKTEQRSTALSHPRQDFQSPNDHEMNVMVLATKVDTSTETATVNSCPRQDSQNRKEHRVWRTGASRGFRGKERCGATSGARLSENSAACSAEVRTRPQCWSAANRQQSGPGENWEMMASGRGVSH